MVYIDKTGIIRPLVEKPGRYFLSRPRRFGKSLLVDTFKELFEGNETLFRGLAIHGEWDWSKRYPVVKIDFAGGTLGSREDLEGKLLPLFDRYARKHGITLSTTGVVNRFIELIRTLYETGGMPAVVLVDEYDKPILDHIEDPSKAEEMRNLLKDFYSCIKEVDEYLQFVFLTGVSKFGKVSIFSGINNLKDLTLDPGYAAICGYTQEDLECDFSEHLSGADWERLRLWYNGYNFLGEPVYNPFDILLFISENKRYSNFWFETGTPEFLVRLLQMTRYFLPDLKIIEAGEELLSSFDIHALEPITLLFQTGYLTIKKHDYYMERRVFTLGFPNKEVKNAFSDYVVGAYTGITHDRIRHGSHAYDALRNADMPALENVVRRLFAGIPWRNFTNNDIIEYEGYYASVLYALFSSITCQVIPEDTGNHGQADLTVMLENTICIMEIKVVEGTVEDAESKPNSALEQLKSRDYARKYVGEHGKKVVEVGMVFSRIERNLAQFGFREI